MVTGNQTDDLRQITDTILSLPIFSVLLPVLKYLTGHLLDDVWFRGIIAGDRYAM